MDDRERVIYKIANNINGKFYIGVSVDYKRRWQAHKRNPPTKMKGDIEIYGWDNFTFTILLGGIIGESAGFEEEIKTIAILKPDYNSTEGGEGFQGMPGVSNHWAKFTIEEVIDIGTRAYNGESRGSINKDYNVCENTLHRVIVGESYREIDRPIVNNIHYSGVDRIQAKLSKKDILDISERALAGESDKSIHKDYPNVVISVIDRVANGEGYKSVKRETRKKHNMSGIEHTEAKLTKEQVIDIGTRAVSGETMESIHKDYQNITIGNINVVARGDSYKDIERPIRQKRKNLTTKLAKLILELHNEGFTVEEIQQDEDFEGFKLGPIKSVIEHKTFSNLRNYIN